MKPTSRPIGYWLRHLHDLIEAQFEAALAEDRLGRRHWQTLHLLHEDPRTAAQLDAALAPFGADGGSAVDDLTRHGWVVRSDDDRLHLTGAGRIAHTQVAARVEAARDLLMRGLTTEQYVETVRVLAVMAGNLESTRPTLATPPATSVGASSPPAATEDR
ncbi:MarR family winged helix-turn-helix transcriptional regulator [Micromonospora sp. NPDC050187]|uniref:MarR family winged helix-turn-helix transcriptional regulator n=1 Tax=Micromonospora sp. NPDC050187 TaxID=3364277 RepID=UPI003796A9F9